ncbi:MAG: histidinol-phosphate transaminase [Leptospira sp.]|nr:histidinol-phosphate transaminase [Leptospira sp.]
MKEFRKELLDLVPYTPGEQPSSTSQIIKLNTNENPYSPSPNCAKALNEIMALGLLRKYPNPSSDSLRESIAKIYGISKDNILVTNGSDEAIRLLFTGILGNQSTIASPDPTYSAYPVFADTTMEDYRFVKVPLLKDFHFDWQSLLASKADLVAFANPNAPTSLLEAKEQVIDFVEKFPGFVLCDEAYIDFAEPGSSCIQDACSKSNLFVSRTFSKSYALAGLRVGFLVGTKENISILHKLKDSYNVGMLDQAIAKAAIEDIGYFNQITSQILITRKRLSQSLMQLGCEVVVSSTNFLFVKPPSSHKAKDWFEKLKNNGIFIRYFGSGVSADYIRITIGTDDESDSVLKAIQKFLEK